MAFSPQKLLVFGCGYLGNRIARKSVSAGSVVWATTRNDQKAQKLANDGIEPLIVDWNDARSLSRLPQVDGVVVAVSYDRKGRLDRYQSQVGGLSRLLDHLPKSTPISYISTTGVYHQTDGVWVDETSPTRPRREGGKVHLQAEQLLHRHRPGGPWSILRLAGIYGPDRVPRAADVIAGRKIASPAGGYLNLVHVDDAAEATIRSLESPSGRLYLVADDQPVLRRAFYQQIASHYGAAEPSFESPDAKRSLRSDSNKRIWNRRMKRELMPTLRFPTYRQGLVSALPPKPRVKT